jgi:acetyl esterase
MSPAESPADSPGYRRFAARSVAAGFYAMSSLGKLHPDSRPERHGVERLMGVPYGGGHAQRLDVYRRADLAGPAPVALYVHGGAFRSLSKDTHWLFALAFARRGYVVFNIDYRLAPQHRYPAGLIDAAEALRWVSEHAEEYGGDAGRIVLAGESAGANLVASLAIATSFRREEPFARALWDADIRPRAVAACYGAFQVSDRARHIPEGLPWLPRQLMLDLPAAYLPLDGSPADLADPVCVLEAADAPARPLPAFFLPVGTGDPLLRDTKRMAAALGRLGAPHEARYYPGEWHGFNALIWRKQARESWQHLFDFVGAWV